MLGQLASADPDADDVGPAQMIDHGEEILWRLLVGEPANGADHRSTGGNAESAARAVSGFRRTGGQFRSGRAVNGHADGADPLGRDQPPPDRLDRDPGPDAQRQSVMRPSRRSMAT